VKSETHTLEIERKGESFLIRTTVKNFFNGKLESQTIVGTLKDGILQVSHAFGTIPITFDKASGNLTDGKDEYKRVN